MEDLNMRDIDADFKRYFPNLNFKLKCFQKNVIENVTKVGNTLCIMPTGGGKSVIYWMAAMECDGITIVVSPLTALIEEQASKLREQGHEVLVFHSGIKSVSRHTHDALAPVVYGHLMIEYHRLVDIYGHTILHGTIGI